MSNLIWTWIWSFIGRFYYLRLFAWLLLALISASLEIKIERELETGCAAPAAFGRYQNVFLSAGELSELQADFPTIWQEYIERLSEYMASTGRTYKSHAATIRRWIADDRRKAAPPARDRDYSVKDGDTV